MVSGVTAECQLTKVRKDKNDPMMRCTRLLRSRRVLFADHEFDPGTRRLTRQGRPVPLGGQPGEILDELLREPGSPVSRETLNARLWGPCAGRIDTSRRLNTAMRALRAALGDAAAEPRFKGHGSLQIVFTTVTHGSNGEPQPTGLPAAALQRSASNAVLLPGLGVGRQEIVQLRAHEARP